MKSIAEMEKLIENFDKFSYYLNDKLERDIEENRKSRFVIRIRNKDGSVPTDATVTVKQFTHEFKFGSSLFYLDQFGDDERRQMYRERFSELFNYAVAPL